MAYCMLGVLDINMPLLCGVGGRAFQRLQKATPHGACGGGAFQVTRYGLAPTTYPVTGRSFSSHTGTLARLMTTYM